MRPRDWFSVGVRLFGVWTFYRGFSDLLASGVWLFGLAPRFAAKDFDDAHTGLVYDLWYAAGFFALAIYFIFGAEHLTRWAFNEPGPPADGDNETGDAE
jgi:hypothetical protein